MKKRYFVEVRYKSGWMTRVVYAEDKWDAERQIREEARKTTAEIIEIKRIYE